MNQTEFNQPMGLMLQLGLALLLTVTQLGQASGQPPAPAGTAQMIGSLGQVSVGHQSQLAGVQLQGATYSDAASHSGDLARWSKHHWRAHGPGWSFGGMDGQRDDRLGRYTTAPVF